jgi:hypothetical protein
MARSNSDRTTDMSNRNSDRSGYTEGVTKLRVPEAAEALDISPEAVRNRLSRGKLQSTKEGNTVYVLLDPDITTDKSADRFRSTEDIARATEALLASKDETIRTLREQLEAEREANRENRRIVAGLVQRIPELEPSPDRSTEAREAPEKGSEEPASTHAPPEAYEPPEQERKRSWWREFLGME